MSTNAHAYTDGELPELSRDEHFALVQHARLIKAGLIEGMDVARDRRTGTLRLAVCQIIKTKP